MSIMSEREKAICEAATRLFVRYGVKRTGMNDIAQEAGIARQTLYNIFPNKEAVLDGAIRMFMVQALAETERGVARAGDLREQLGIVFEHLVRRPYAMIHASPHTDDLVDGVGPESRKLIGEYRDRFRRRIETLLSPAENEIRASGISVHQLADAIEHFASAAKNEARDQAHLDELLQSLTAMVLLCVK
jgi:AcrR family transcriptional regulator